MPRQHGVGAVAEMSAQPRAGGDGVTDASPARGGEAVGQRLESVGDQRGTEAPDAAGAADVDDVANHLRREPFGVEAAAIAAVDLQVEQGRGDPTDFEVRRATARLTDGTDEAAV